MAGKRSDPTAAVDSTADIKAQNNGSPVSKTEKPSPVLDAISKRLRAARKRLGKIKSIEEIKDKELNPDQLETVRSKPGVLAIIDELEKITPLLQKAASEEVKAAFEAKEAKEAANAAKRAEKERLRDEATAAQQDTETPKEEEETTAAAADDPKPVVDRILEMLYFSQLFGNPDNAPSTWAQDSERTSCITYDLHNEGDQLTQADLLAIASFGHSLIRREPQKTISHSEALSSCKELAQSFLSDGGRLGDSLQRILNTGYFTTTPQECQVPSMEGEGIAGGSESSEYRNLAVSGAEAVLEAPSTQTSTFAPQQALHGMEIPHPTAQFYNSVYDAGPSYDHSAANAAFHSVPFPDHQPVAGVNFMVNSTLDGGAPANTQLPPQGHQQAPAPHAQQAQQPQQQTDGSGQNQQNQPQQQQHARVHHHHQQTPYQPQQQAQPSSELKTSSGHLDNTDAHVAAPAPTTRDNRDRRNRYSQRSGRGSGGERTQSGDISGQAQEGGGRNGGRSNNRSRGGRGNRAPRDGREGPQGGRGEGRGSGTYRQNRSGGNRSGQGPNDDSRGVAAGAQPQAPHVQ